MPGLRLVHWSYSHLSFKGIITGKSLLLLAFVCFTLMGGNRAGAAAAATTTTLTLTAGGSAVTTVDPLTVVTLTAAVATGSAPVTAGQVIFCDATASYCTDIHQLGAAQLTSAGTAILRFRPAAGTHSYKAIFVGTNGSATSASSVSTLTVGVPHSGKYSSTTTLATGMNHTGITLTATVTGSALVYAAPVPSGTVTFLDTTEGNSSLGSAELVPGPAAPTWTNPQNFDSIVAGGMIVADFNGDGILDMAVPNYTTGSGQVSIYLGNGDGSFTSFGNALSFETDEGWLPQYGRVSATGDFNGDGNPDLAVVEYAENKVLILLGNGDGTFRQAPSLSTGSYPSSVAAADFNGDGIPDLAVANAESNSVTIQLGNGDGTFTAAPSPATGSQPFDLVAGDFTGDGKVDLAVTTSLDSSVTILLGNGNGSFRTGTPVQITASLSDHGDEKSITSADLNGDGKLDLAVTSAGGVTILLGNGDGTFKQLTNHPPAGSAGVAVADINGDGKADLVAGSLLNLTVLFGNGDGTFTPAGTNLTSGSTILYNSIGIGDFNGDGFPDIASTSAPFTRVNPSEASVYLTQMMPTATATVSGIPVPTNPLTHELVAQYSGDNNYDSSESSETGIWGAPELSLSSTSLAFGEVPWGYTETQVVTATNTSSQNTLNIQTVVGMSDFTVAGTCGGPLAPGASCSLVFEYTPRTQGQTITSAQVNDGDPLFPFQEIDLSGTAFTPSTSSLSLSTTNLVFGSWAVGFPSPSQEVVVTNTSSTGNLYFRRIWVTGANAASYRVPDNCGNGGQGIAPGASCRISVIFNPVAEGAQNATLNLADTASTSPQTISLSGTGVVASTPSISLSTTSLAFGSWAVGFPSPSQEVFVTNTSSTAVLYFRSISVTGANASSFLAPNTCGSAGGSLAAGASCRISVIFNPVATGTQSATINLIDTASNSPQTISLSGTGIASSAASVSLSTTSLVFGSWAVGSASPSQEVIVTNTSSTATLYFTSISVTGANALSFRAPNTCGYAGGSLAPGASCRISAIFNPVAAGTQSATINLIDNASTSPQSVSLSGTGLN